MPEWGLVLATSLAALLGLIAAVHAIQFKRDPQTAVMWVAVVLLSPFVGALAYLVFGINRIQRRATRIRSQLDRLQTEGGADCTEERELARAVQDEPQLLAVHHVSDHILRRPLVSGNRLELLSDGEQAYPAMLAAIDEAEHTVSLASYIFDSDATGERFVAALVRAHRRGVQVRVMIDAAGARYSKNLVTSMLEQAGVPCVLFHPRPLFLRSAMLNLRNHRKILVQDGRVAFTGGINIRQRHVISAAGAPPVRDVHFRVEGPIVRQLQEVFAEDWAFAHGEGLAGDGWFPDLQPCGDMIARTIAAGPDEDLDTLRLTLHGAIAAARRSIRIVTPYFLPDRSLVTALCVAAMRGVEVDLLVPERGNVPIVRWAMWACLPPFLERGCRVWLTGEPFDHAKLMVVDGHWAKIGSANWDARSLRLNFELDVQVFGADFAARVEREIVARRDAARKLTSAELAAGGLLRTFRDRVARLFSALL